MEHSFDRFVHFGVIADQESRKKLVQGIFDKLVTASEHKLTVNHPEIMPFIASVELYIDHNNVKKICYNNQLLSEKITNDIIDFIVKTKKVITQSESQFDTELQLIESFRNSTASTFEIHWETIDKFLEATYRLQELDRTFYKVELKKSCATAKITTAIRWNYDSMKEHFIDQWNALLLKKKIKYEMEIIAKQREPFANQLFKNIESLIKIQEVLEVVSSALGRFWDGNQSHWQRSNFDQLKYYADLLKKDQSIIELAKILGQMSQASKEIEEQQMATMQYQPQWKVMPANASDLIGIHESDDLSNLLPSETVFLSDATLQTIFYKKFGEKKLQTFEHQTKVKSFKANEIIEKKNIEKLNEKGPFIVCVDTSGSMHGIPETVAKSICLALLKQALKDNRKCYLISFSTQIETLNLTDSKNSIPKLLDFLSMSFYGGTDARPAIEESLRMIKTEDYKGADVVMISDFIMPDLDRKTKNELQKAKENKTKFHNIIIGNHPNTKLINDYNTNWIYNPNDLQAIKKLITNNAIFT